MPDLITTKQLAEMLQCSHATVLKYWRDWGGFKIGDGKASHIRFHASKTMELIEDRGAPEPDVRVDSVLAGYLD